MLDLLGTVLLWIVALALTITLPFSEFARGMATNPDSIKPSLTATVMSMIGILLIVGLLTS